MKVLKGIFREEKILCKGIHYPLKGSVKAMKKLKSILDLFYRFSSIKFKVVKSVFYVAGMKQEDVN